MEHVTEPNFISTLGLNWKLFAAQLINFGIVLLILWKWVFRPIVTALESRRKKIEDSVKQAEKIEKRLQEFEAEHQAGLKQSRAEAQDILGRAESLASQQKADMVLEAEALAKKILGEARATITAEKQKMLEQVRDEIVTVALMTTEKIIREKLDETKDRELINKVLGDIK